jgi:pimeloyl-ACP methyl ester carboxylesterase
MAKTIARLIVGLCALAAIATGLWQLHSAADGLRISRTFVGKTPVTVYRPASDAPAPVVVIAHGFAGSQQLMQPYAQTLARNGYVAVTFDFLGHGRNPEPMRGDINEGLTITGQLLRELGAVADYARALPGSDGKMAVLGHSMASDIVVRFGRERPEIDATIAVSVFSKEATPTLPRNLLVIVGALEPSMLIDEGLRIVNLVAGGSAVAGQTYGDFKDGTARKLVLSGGVEHIGVLYGQDGLREALAWMNQVFARQGDGFVDRRGRWLGLLFLGLIALAWPLSTLLPRAAAVPMGASLSWKPLLLAAVIPALVTPLILWKMPTDFLPILLGDYLTLHFLLYGLLTGGILLALQRGKAPLPTAPVAWSAIAIAAVAVSAYNVIGFGLPVDAFAFSFLPIPERIPLIAAIACGTVPYFVTAEWMAHGERARRGGYALAKFCFLLSLSIAVALNLSKLFFLIIIVPAILLLFLAFGLISNWSYKATNHPLPGALANAAVFAWAIAVTFPMVIR